MLPHAHRVDAQIALLVLETDGRPRMTYAGRVLLCMGELLTLLPRCTE